MNAKRAKKMSKHRRNPFSNALTGILETYRTERNFKIHVIVALAVTALGAWMDVAPSDWYWIALCIAVVFITEILNTALEALVYLASPNDHPLAKKFKDTAAGAVLIASVFSVVVGGVIFFPKLWVLFFS